MPIAGLRAYDRLRCFGLEACSIAEMNVFGRSLHRIGVFVNKKPPIAFLGGLESNGRLLGFVADWFCFCEGTGVN